MSRAAYIFRPMELSRFIACRLHISFACYELHSGIRQYVKWNDKGRMYIWMLARFLHITSKRNKQPALNAILLTESPEKLQYTGFM